MYGNVDQMHEGIYTDSVIVSDEDKLALKIEEAIKHGASMKDALLKAIRKGSKIVSKGGLAIGKNKKAAGDVTSENILESKRKKNKVVRFDRIRSPKWLAGSGTSLHLLPPQLSHLSVSQNRLRLTSVPLAVTPRLVAAPATPTPRRSSRVAAMSCAPLSLSPTPISQAVPLPTVSEPHVFRAASSLLSRAASPLLSDLSIPHASPNSKVFCVQPSQFLRSLGSPHCLSQFRARVDRRRGRENEGGLG